MSNRFIKIPEPTPFIDPATGDVVQVRGEDGEISDAEPKTHVWFLHTYILSHPIFSMKSGGYDAVRDQKLIGKAIDNAADLGISFYEVTADQLRMMQLTMRRATSETKDKEKSSEAMRPMTNFEAWSLFAHMDAIMDASTNKPMTNAEEDPETAS